MKRGTLGAGGSKDSRPVRTFVGSGGGRPESGIVGLSLVDTTFPIDPVWVRAVCYHTVTGPLSNTSESGTDRGPVPFCPVRTPSPNSPTVPPGTFPSRPGSLLPAFH